MKRKNVFKLTSLLLAIGLVAATYAWWGCREKNEWLIESIYADSLHSRLVLADMPGFLDYSIENNASDAYLRLQLIRYSEHATALERVFFELYTQTGEKRYYSLFLAMSNIEAFLTDVSNDEAEKMRDRVENNLKTLKRLENPFRELPKYQKPEEIPESLAEKLLKLSEELG